MDPGAEGGAGFEGGALAEEVDDEGGPDEDVGEAEEAVVAHEEAEEVHEDEVGYPGDEGDFADFVLEVEEAGGVDEDHPADPGLYPCGFLADVSEHAEEEFVNHGVSFVWG